MDFDKVLNNMKKNTILILSHAFLICFSCLIFIGSKFIIPYCFQALLRFYSVPFIILLLALLSINIIKMYQEKWSMKSEYCFSTQILLVLIALNLATIFAA